ncbi:response regulator [Acaryochloris marina NIES-2412]|uniref:response regulator n=1 Tax=Acaryochloris marina TaxID=155978 RepID=UPI00405A1695
MSTKKILLIDDDTDIQTLTEMGLTLSANWVVLLASSGQEGIEIATAESPDAILLDVMMPDMDGPETLKELRSHPQTQSIPIIFLTAKAQAKDQHTLYAAGADGVITKPFDLNTLATQISDFLEW